MTVREEPPGVAIRPMTRADVDGFAAWGRHDDPLYMPYNVPALDAAAADDLWRFLAGRPAERRPYAGLVDGRFAAQFLLRLGPHGTGDLGVALDPALVGRGIGTRLLRAFADYARSSPGLQRLTLDVASYNERAVRAYRSAGFTVTGERYGDPEPGLVLGPLIAAAGPSLAGHFRCEAGSWRVRIYQMEKRLDADADQEPHAFDRPHRP